MLKFAHVFEEASRYSTFTVDVMNDPSSAKIEFQICDQGISLSANLEGYLHRARILAELVTRDFGDEGTHFHKPEWLKKPVGSKQEVSIELFNGDWSDNAQP